MGGSSPAAPFVPAASPPPRALCSSWQAWGSLAPAPPGLWPTTREPARDLCAKPALGGGGDGRVWPRRWFPLYEINTFLRPQTQAPSGWKGRAAGVLRQGLSGPEGKPRQFFEGGWGAGQGSGSQGRWPGIGHFLHASFGPRLAPPRPAPTSPQPIGRGDPPASPRFAPPRRALKVYSGPGR